MAARRMKVAKLDKSSLAKVKALEKDVGCCLVALEPEYRLSDLTPAKLRKIQAAEKALGVVLLAYEPK